MKKIKLKKNNISNEKNGKRDKRKMWKSILNICLLGAIGIISIGLIFALYIVISSPDFDKGKLYQKEPTILYDRNGDELARVGSKDSTVVTYDEIPDVLIDALIATEDSRFFQHNGLDLFRFLKASFLQLLGQGYAGGASTISMQVIKNTYTNKDDEGLSGIIRKFTDIYMSVFKLEANYTKEEIIEFYFNSQWFASNGNVNVSDGIWGIEQASLYFFGKSSKDLNLAEASLLVGMFQNTRTNNPYNYPANARKRQNTVLKLMVRHGYITEEQKDEVLKIPISSLLTERENTGLQVNSNQAFIDYVLQEVSEDLGIDPYQTSYKIYTTYDPKVQKVLEKAENGDFYKYTDDVVEEGIAVTSTEDGSIIALSGGRNYQAKGMNFAYKINRQPGSTAKPIVDYAMYIQNISKSTYAMFLDEPTSYSNGTSISNYDNKHLGLITMRYALEDSRNIPALLAFKAVAAKDINLIKDYVHSVGIDYGKDLFESAAIGGFNGVSPLQLSAAYGVFARGGYYIEPYSYTKVINNETEEETVNNYEKKKVLDDSTSYLINNILMGAYKGTGVSGTDIAAKTGTTNLDSDTKDKYKLPSGAIMDAWMVSYSPSYSIALWYGYESLDDTDPSQKIYITSSMGSTARSKIMNGLASGIHKKNQRFKVPKTITSANIELETFPAQLCSSYTPADKCTTEYFVAGAEPTEVSSRYDTLENPTNGTYTYNNNTITLKWEEIKTPDAINLTTLAEHFNKYYSNYAEKYFNKRVEYNNANIGTLGYEVYLKNSDGTETYLGYTGSNSFIYNVSVGGEYKFIVKSSYSIFKNNKSSGLTINAKTIDSNVNDLIDTNNDNDRDNQDNNKPDNTNQNSSTDTTNTTDTNQNTTN